MMIAPAASTIPHLGPELENFMPAQRESLLRGLVGQLQASTRAADQNLGHLEEQLLRNGHELFRQMLEKAAQENPRARQRVDYYYVSQHLWAVARTFHPDDAAAARAWVEALLA